MAKKRIKLRITPSAFMSRGTGKTHQTILKEGKQGILGKKIKRPVNKKKLGKQIVVSTNVIDILKVNPPAVKYSRFKIKPIRKPFHHIHLGQRASGKTNESKRFIKKYVAQKKRLKKTFMILIVDHFNEYGDIAKDITINKLCAPRKKSLTGVFRLQVDSSFNGQFLLTKAVDSLCDTLLIIDGFEMLKQGFNSIAWDSIHRAIDSETRNVDTYIIGHTSRLIPSNIRKFTTTLKISNTTEKEDYLCNTFVGKTELIQLAFTAKSKKFLWEYWKVVKKYKTSKTINKKQADLEQFISIDIDIRNEVILGISESTFCQAVESFARPEIGNYSINGMRVFSKRINSLLKYR